MKNITVRDDVYKELARLKKEGESFSDVIMRLIESKSFNMEDYFGILKNSEVLDEIEKYSKKFREESKVRF